MRTGYLIGSIILFVLRESKSQKRRFLGGVVFHGVTAILALWLFLKALGKA